MSDKTKLILCPYCGNTQTEPEDRCITCGGFFDPLSLKVTQQHMGPWFVRDRNNPFRPGCSYEVLVKQIEKGKIKPTTIIRGPTTKQFWSVARHVPGVSNLLGYCHNCGTHVEPAAESCNNCGEVFFQPRLRDNLGLAAAGAEVHVQPKLSDSGAFEAMADQQHTIDQPMKLPGLASRAIPPAAAASKPVDAKLQPIEGIASTIAAFSSSHARQVTDQPVGSSILARLRTGPAFASNDAGPVVASPSVDAATVSAATKQASASRDAMAWMTGSDQSELDSLATAAADYVPPQKAGINWLTWVLIAVNLALLAAGAAVVFIAMRGRPDNLGINNTPSHTNIVATGTTDAGQPANPGDRTSPTTDPADNSTIISPRNTGNGKPTVKLPDVVDSPTDPKATAPLQGGQTAGMPGVADPSGNRTNIFTDDARKPMNPTEEARLNWASRFNEAHEAEKRGDIDLALKIYTEIKTKAPADVQPEGVNDAISRVESAIRRRNIEKMLGK